MIAPRAPTRLLPPLAALVLLSGLFTLPTQASEGSTPTAPAAIPLEDLRIFADVFNQIRSGYVEDIDDSTLLEYAIRGMLTELDPHSAYLSRDALEDLQTTTSGEFSGLGIEVGMEGGFIQVISPIDETPAARAGLQSGDVLLELDGKSLKGMRLDEAIELMRGPVGSDVTLMIGRPGESQPFDVVLTRELITVASVRHRMLEPGYGYLRIAQFQNKTGSDLEKALRALQKDEALKGLVLDLRNNPGGVLRASVEVASAFLDGGLVVYTEGRLQNAQGRYSASPGDLADGVPVVVLINSGSASAAEIVAGALQDRGRAVIMGTESFGKGSVQTILPLSEKHAIKLTTALYYTPNGRSIQALGIEPDVPVERANVTTLGRGAGRSESSLARHLESPTGNGDDGTASEQRARDASELLRVDNQLYEALTLLKGVNIFTRQGTRTAMADAPKP